jgi:D-lactate dehydrogenase
MLNAPYDELQRQLAAFIPVTRLVSDPLRLLAWGSDASFYRLVPKLVVVVTSEDEARRVLVACAALNTPVTFRAAGTSLSGQALSDSVLVLLGDGWQGMTVAADASTITLQPGVIGAAANRRLAPRGRKIGPDPASIDAAMIGGIAANNASGMCCGTTQNSYKTLAGLRIVLADGTLLDTRDAASRSAFTDAKAGAGGRLERAGPQRARRREPGPTHPPQVPAEEHHRLRPERAGGLHRPDRHAGPPDDRQRRHAGLHERGDLLHCARARAQGQRADPLRAPGDGLQRRDAAQAQPGGRGGAAGPRLAARRAGQAGMPASLLDLPADGAALLVETRAATAVALSVKIDAIAEVLQGTPLAAPLRFTTDAAESAALWNVRKGIFPAVGAVRRTGTTVIIEDVAFPVERLAEAVQDLQRLFVEFDYPEAIVYGHALEGNLHFVFTQDFGDAAEIDRYRRFMDEVCALVVKKYDGSLKAEHGTGRNMAPFVEMEWGTPAFQVMQRIKALLDPQGLLNPGVILNADAQSHLKNLKPLPAADPLVDKCIECGFCEPKCPSRGMTLSPRQRIVGWREISRLDVTGAEPQRSAELKQLYDYQGIQTCAACGLCATACPVGIETGLLIKALRGRSKGALAKQVADVAARHYGGLTTGVRLGLGAANLLHGAVGTTAMKGVLDGLRKASGGRLPKWSPALARPVNFVPKPQPLQRAERLVYFPSCAARNMGAQRGDDGLDMLPSVAERLFQRAGFDVVYPQRMSGLCCGQPFESKGLDDAANLKSAELEAALAEASEGGRWPVVFDTSPCAYRMKKFLAGRLPLQDSVEFVHDTLLPRLKLTPQPQAVAVHPVCSVRKMGTADKLMAIAGRCSAQVVAVDQVQCCGFAGERGFMRPELNEHALRHLKAALPAGCDSGYATSRTCEIGLSEMAELPYRSILYLVERCSREQP